MLVCVTARWSCEAVCVQSFVSTLGRVPQLQWALADSYQSQGQYIEDVVDDEEDIYSKECVYHVQIVR